MRVAQRAGRLAPGQGVVKTVRAHVTRRALGVRLLRLVGRADLWLDGQGGVPL
jgi:hypothetical protein